MKMGRLHTICIIIIVMLLSPLTVSSDEHNLVFELIEMNYDAKYLEKSRNKEENGTTFVFYFTFQIENLTNKTITTSRSNVGFINMGYAEHRNWEDRAIESGGPSVMLLKKFDPGYTEISTYGAIFFNDTYTLPEGHYNVTIFQKAWIDETYVTPYTVDFLIVGAVITHTRTVPLFTTNQVDGLIESSTTNSNLDVNLTVPLFPIILAVIIVGTYRKINDRSIFCK